MNVGEKLKKARKDAGLTQRQLAEKMGCTVQNISRFEQGNFLKYETMIRLAHAIGVSVDDIWTQDEQNANLYSQYAKQIDSITDTLQGAVSEIRSRYNALSASDRLKVTEYVNDLYFASLARKDKDI